LNDDVICAALPVVVDLAMATGKLTEAAETSVAVMLKFVIELIGST
jgi:hypothetical protein